MLRGGGDDFIPDPAYDNLYADDTIPHAKTDTPEQFMDLPSFFRYNMGRDPGRADEL